MGAIDRDQAETLKALKEFEKLVARFPNSKFSVLAERHILECRKRLAEKEFYVGNFYFSRGKYKAALGRFEIIAREYPGIGLDDKVRYFLEESRKRLIKQEAEEKIKKEKEEKKTGPGEKRAAANKTAQAATAETKLGADKK
jgi:outer membrane protein assembly factor BamD